MKKTHKKFSAILMVVVLLVSTWSMTAFAANTSSTVTYKGRSTGFEFEPGSVYTDTDLFDNFKNVMPGDVREEVVTVTNKYSGCDYIKVWMRGVLHEQDVDVDGDGEINVISPEVMKKLIARQASASDAEDANMTELQYMNDFLKQLKLTVWKGEKLEKNIIYEGHPDALEVGFENGNVYLGALRYNGSVTLNVKLEVPIELDNRYADRIGEVDWVFVIEEHNDPSSNPDNDRDPNPSKDPTSGSDTTVTPESPNSPMDAPVDRITDVPKTGDDTVVWPYVTLLGIGIVGMVLTLFKKRKKENN